jgi:hypothetical protein
MQVSVRFARVHVKALGDVLSFLDKVVSSDERSIARANTVVRVADLQRWLLVVETQGCGDCHRSDG